MASSEPEGSNVGPYPQTGGPEGITTPPAEGEPETKLPPEEPFKSTKSRPLPTGLQGRWNLQTSRQSFGHTKNNQATASQKNKRNPAGADQGRTLIKWAGSGHWWDVRLRIHSHARSLRIHSFSIRLRLHSRAAFPTALHFDGKA